MTPEADSGGASGRREWRPMAFGSRPARAIRDPVIEPFWPGRRVLVHLAPGVPDRGSLAIVDESGLELAGHPEIRVALLDAALADDMVLDGYLVELPRRDAAGVFGGEPAATVPGLAGTARQLVLGGRAARRDEPEQAQLSPAVAPDPSSAADAQRRAVATVVAFVVVDVLAIDADELLEVPLLERKRLLDSAVAVGELVRRSPHVRPPVESWYGQWRAFGFRQIAVKSANSRYVPGRPSEHWAVATIPRG
jgi:hypothetical protein